MNVDWFPRAESLYLLRFSRDMRSGKILHPFLVRQGFEIYKDSTTSHYPETGRDIGRRVLISSAG